MSAPEIARRAAEAFRADAEEPPPLTLRGGYALDGYDVPSPFDPALDEPTDAYLEGFAFWGLGYLDARSWRHYLPRLIDYALRRPDDPSMAAEALVRSLRPPDRYPPRLGSLSPPQEAAVTAFLEEVALGEAAPHLREEAQQALEEWWLPGARSRPTPAEIEAARRQPVTYRLHDGGLYRLEVPASLAGSGVRDIPQESRRVETWGGYLRSDAHTVIAVNVSPIEFRSLADAVALRTKLFRDPPPPPRAVGVRGARQARRLDGLTHGDSPAEPQSLSLLVAEDGRSVVTLTVRSWPRDDVGADVERIVRSFELVPSA